MKNCSRINPSYMVLLSLITLVILGNCKKEELIHNSIKDGEAYGFSIGDDKKTTLEKAKRTFYGTKVKIFLSDKSGTKFLPFEEKLGEEIFMDNEMWYFIFNNDNFDTLKLFFKHEQLVEIIRDKGRNELP